jgi:hypothetical protein
MPLRTPTLLALLLAGAVLAIGMPGSSAGLLLLTPALAVLLPLLFSAYPGEKAAARLASWFARAGIPDTAASASTALAAPFNLAVRAGFSSANGSRGPPRFAL